MSHRISQPRQNSSSTMGMSAHDEIERKSMKAKFRFRLTGSELVAGPVSQFSKSQ